VLLAALAYGCGSGSSAVQLGLSDAAELEGGSVGVVAGESIPALALRYLLSEKYSLDLERDGGDVTLLDAPADTLVASLKEREADAVILPVEATYTALEDSDLRVLTPVSEEIVTVAGAPIMATVLVSNALDGVEPAALEELNRLLTSSLTYYEANQRDVLATVAEESGIDEDLVRWQAGRQAPRFGQASAGVYEQVLTVWQMALQLGDIAAHPAISDKVFTAQGGRAAGDSARMTLSLAVLDDPLRRAALYAIEAGIVKSDSVDLDVTYLKHMALADAATSGQYSVVEANPLLLTVAPAAGLDLVLLSAGVEDSGSLLLFVRNGR
jgi:ABC-type nitrate/sulfonate/bicarbonate transport system substrate-binding protein